MSWPVPGTLMIEPTESESKVQPNRKISFDFFSDVFLRVQVIIFLACRPS